MVRSFLKGKTRLLLIAGALFAVCCVAPARAQMDAASAADNGQLLNRINELQNQVQTLSRAVYQGNKAAITELAADAAKQPNGTSMSPAALSDFYTRITALENEQQALTGQIEKLGFQMQQLTTRVNRMQSDTDERFQQLGQNAPVNGGTATAGNGTPVTAAATVPPVSTAAPPDGSATTNGSSPSAQRQNQTLGQGKVQVQSQTLGTLGGQKGAQTLYESAFSDVRAHKYAAAQSKFETFLQQYPDSHLCANAEYWMGEIYYAQGKYKEAARTFATGYQKYPKSSKAEDSLYKLGLSLSKMDRVNDACLSLKQIHRDFPDDMGPLYQKAQAALTRLNCH